MMKNRYITILLTTIVVFLSTTAHAHALGITATLGFIGGFIYAAGGPLTGLAFLGPAGGVFATAGAAFGTWLGTPAGNFDE